SSIFISMGRGKTVDENALIEAIKSGHIAGAGLDVFAMEPLPATSPLWYLENVIISPHIGGSFDRYDEFCMILFRENLTRYLTGKPLLNKVNRKAGY
ncbi:MAG: D-2-hydroxyacid dehydrogenase, partial [Proteobacteria bacterium]|nr:D-2-hydroxyacid dehydrogenase [Pseudomonadota bacterium]